MNHFNLEFLANEQLADRLAEADRHRLAHAARVGSKAKRQAPRVLRLSGPRVAIGSLFRRVAFH